MCRQCSIHHPADKKSTKKACRKEPLSVFADDASFTAVTIGVIGGAVFGGSITSPLGITAGALIGGALTKGSIEVISTFLAPRLSSKGPGYSRVWSSDDSWCMYWGG
mmetsp:Transcript_14234/g.23728  ORF Transcript_14234/g.23728 Transcript_14234/m.23728 type:complete len:107 (-) Transcript_14234:86-406(-)